MPYNPFNTKRAEELSSGASRKTKRAANLLETLPSCSPYLRLHKMGEIREVLAEARTQIEMAEALLS